MSTQRLDHTWNRTDGKCHFCGRGSSIENRENECSVRLRRALDILDGGVEGISSVTIEPPEGPPSNKVTAIKALREAVPPELDATLKRLKRVMDAVDNGEAQVVEVYASAAVQLVKDLRGAGFEVSKIADHARLADSGGEEVILSPQATKVLRALRAKPGLYLEVRAVLLTEGI